MDWKPYTAYANVPATAVKIQWGATLNGKGNLWLDAESATLEIVDVAGR